MVTFVCWKWKPPEGYRSTFGPETVHVLRAMINRHYPHPHEFVCITDDPKDLDGVQTLRLWNDYASVPSPSGPRNPSCYRRLRLFDPEMADIIGSRIFSLDLDLVIVNDITTLVDRPEPFVIWGDTNPTTFYNGSLMLLTAGARAHLWTEFDPVESPRRASAAGHFGSDQGWISYRLGPNEPKWTTADGVYSFRN